MYMYIRDTHVHCFMTYMLHHHVDKLELTFNVDPYGGQGREVGRTECLVTAGIVLRATVTTVELVVEVDRNLVI